LARGFFHRQQPLLIFLTHIKNLLGLFFVLNRGQQFFFADLAVSFAYGQAQLFKITPGSRFGGRRATID